MLKLKGRKQYILAIEKVFVLVELWDVYQKIDALLLICKIHVSFWDSINLS